MMQLLTTASALQSIIICGLRTCRTKPRNEPNVFLQKSQLHDFFRYHLPYIFSILSFVFSFKTDDETSGSLLCFSYLSFIFPNLLFLCVVLWENPLVFFPSSQITSVASLLFYITTSSLKFQQLLISKISNRLISSSCFKNVNTLKKKKRM